MVRANVGRWISEDPIGFRGKDNNLVRYVRNKQVVLIDVLGFQWRIYRENNATAKAFTDNETSSNTLSNLANLIHMDVSDVLKWITADGTYKVVLGVWKSKEKKIEEIGNDEKWCPEQLVEIPNTVFAGFFASDVPGFLEKFNVDNTFMQSKGVHVMKYFNPNYPPESRETIFKQMLNQYSSQKMLWGLHLSAHSGTLSNNGISVEVFGGRLSEGGPLITYNSLNLFYKLGIYYGFGCTSVIGTPYILSNSPKHRYWTTEELLAPDPDDEQNNTVWKAPYISHFWEPRP
jgi:hypothetical protein